MCSAGTAAGDRVNAHPGVGSPLAMTSGNGSNAPSVTGSTPQNAENKPPQAIVKPQILTHLIEGFVIQEGAEPFPVSLSSHPLHIPSLLPLPNAIVNKDGMVFTKSLSWRQPRAYFGLFLVVCFLWFEIMEKVFISERQMWKKFPVIIYLRIVLLTCLELQKPTRPIHNIGGSSSEG